MNGVILSEGGARALTGAGRPERRALVLELMQESRQHQPARQAQQKFTPPDRTMASSRASVGPGRFLETGETRAKDLG